ncbi:MAG: tetratricopeptide repeat protein, partial [Methylococcales bacterium]
MSIKNDQIAFLQTQLQTKKPEISAKAKELAKQIPDTAYDYALALKAIPEERFDEAMRLLDRAQAKKEAELADIYIAKGNTQYYQGFYAEAAQWVQKALALKPDDARILNNTGIMLYHAGQYGQAEPLYQRSLAISEKALGPDHPDVATSLNNLALLYSAQGAY